MLGMVAWQKVSWDAAIEGMAGSSHIAKPPLLSSELRSDITALFDFTTLHDTVMSLSQAVLHLDMPLLFFNLGSYGTF